MVPEALILEPKYLTMPHKEIVKKWFQNSRVCMLLESRERFKKVSSIQHVKLFLHWLHLKLN